MDQSIRATGIVVLLGFTLAGCGKPSAPKSATEFTVETVEAPIRHMSLGQLKGKKVVLDFWATWCPPCKETMPQLDELYKEYGSRVEFLAISSEDRADLRAFAPKSGVSYPLYMDTNGSAMNAFDVDGIPRLIILDEKGQIAYDETGAPLDMVKIRSVLDRRP